MNGAIITLNNVTKTYGNVVALNQVSLTLMPGRIVGLLGPNGSGKTTLLKVLMRIIKQQSGFASICGTSIGYETRKFISFMPDREFLYDSMTVNDAIEYYKDMFIDFDINKAMYLCNKLNLSTQMNFKLDKLSKGNLEKVVLMLTLSRNVPVYLLDEPLGSLDPLIKHEMLTVIKECSTPNNLILISTHLVKDTEEILDEVIFLSYGRIIMYDHINNIRQSGKSLEQCYIEVFSHV